MVENRPNDQISLGRETITTSNLSKLNQHWDQGERPESEDIFAPNRQGDSRAKQANNLLRKTTQSASPSSQLDVKVFDHIEGNPSQSPSTFNGERVLVRADINNDELKNPFLDDDEQIGGAGGHSTNRFETDTVAMSVKVDEKTYCV